jgi:hypothetical protein
MFAGSHGLTQSQLQSTASFKSHDLTNIDFRGIDLSGWNFQNQNLERAFFTESILVGTDFTNANLREVYFLHVNLTNVNFTQANLMNTLFDIYYSGMNFSQADTRGALMPIPDGLMGTNIILWDGTIKGLALTEGQTLTVRNYIPVNYHPNSIPITIEKGMKLDSLATLQVILDGKPWNSTISFAPGIPVDCNGTLDLTADPGANLLAQLGQKCRLFNWSGVNHSGAFRVTSNYNWDTTQLYTTGEVALAYSPNLADTKWTGKVNSNWNNAGNWTAGVPSTGKIVEFNAATPGHQPFLQNIGGLWLKGILFAPGAGTHYLGGPMIRLGSGDSNDGDTTAIVCMSKNDQFIGTPLELDAETVVNVTDSGILYLCGEINGYNKLTKKGIGTVILENSDYYSSETVIEEGVFALDEIGQIAYSPITNDATFRILAGDHTVNSIAGGGTTEVLSGSLTANSIVQDSLVIGNRSSAGSASNLTPSVPEPGIFILLTAGLLGLVLRKIGGAKSTRHLEKGDRSPR